MSKPATKAANSPFYLARMEAAKVNDRFSSREGAADETGIDRTRLARIELDSITPYPEEVMLLADAYDAPQLLQKVMYELQRQSIEIKRTQQDISSLKKQLSELRGLFKGKERKSLEGRIELLEDLEKRLHKSLEQIVKREGYPNVQAFQKVYNKAEELIIEYNEELRVWKNQTEQKKEKPLEQPKKASVLEKLHRYQQEGRQQPKRSVKKKTMDRER